MRRRKPSALGYLIRDDLAACGRTARFGDQHLRQSDSARLGLARHDTDGAERVGGIIEVPELAACLTLNKGDFIRAGARGATYLGFRKAIQEAVGKQLAAWGDSRASSDEAPPREVRPLQRDLAQVLEDLAADFPLLGSLVEQRAGGQKRLPLGVRGGNGDGRAFVSASVVTNGGKRNKDRYGCNAEQRRSNRE